MGVANISLVLSVFALFFSMAAFYLNFKKDAHRVRLKHRSLIGQNIDELWINNDSSFSINVSSIGQVGADGTVHWAYGLTKKNSQIGCPIEIEGRRTFKGEIKGTDYNFSRNFGNVYGLLVQLECGRSFVSVGTLPFKQALFLKLRSLVSRLSQGKHGFPVREFHDS